MCLLKFPDFSEFFVNPKKGSKRKWPQYKFPEFSKVFINPKRGIKRKWPQYKLPPTPSRNPGQDEPDIVFCFKPQGIPPSSYRWEHKMNAKDIPKNLKDVTPALHNILMGHHKKYVGKQAQWKLTNIGARWVNMGVHGGGRGEMDLNKVDEGLRDHAFDDIRVMKGYVTIKYKKA